MSSLSSGFKCHHNKNRRNFSLTCTTDPVAHIDNKPILSVVKSFFKDKKIALWSTNQLENELENTKEEWGIFPRDTRTKKKKKKYI